MYENRHIRRATTRSPQIPTDAAPPHETAPSSTSVDTAEAETDLCPRLTLRGQFPLLTVNSRHSWQHHLSTRSVEFLFRSCIDFIVISRVVTFFSYPPSLMSLPQQHEFTSYCYVFAVTGNLASHVDDQACILSIMLQQRHNHDHCPSQDRLMLKLVINTRSTRPTPCGIPKVGFNMLAN